LISFQVNSGELFGFLGPNGAGKTTTINMLTGLARLDAGTITIGCIECTRNPKAAQPLTGIVPDESNLYPELTGYKTSVFVQHFTGYAKSNAGGEPKNFWKPSASLMLLTASLPDIRKE
jgi:ABC-2 type transport system ATP-binding protein